MVHYSIQLYGTCYKGPDNSLVAIEFALLNSPFNVNPGELVELRTYANVSPELKVVGVTVFTTS